MAWRIEDSIHVSADLARIYDHLEASHEGFGHSLEEAVAMAEMRVSGIYSRRKTLLIAPHRGTLHEIHGQLIRHVTIDRAIYWFSLDDASQTVRIEGIFFGGQDHLGRMLARLTAE